MAFLKLPSHVLHPRLSEKFVNAKDPGHLVNETVGPLFVACIISTALFGLTSAQSCLYFKRHSQDNTGLKSVVVTLLFLETFHLILIIHALFDYTITNHGISSHLNTSVWSLLIQVVPATLVVAIVQYVWIIRIKTLSQNHRRAQIAAAMLSLVFINAGMSIGWMAAA